MAAVRRPARTDFALLDLVSGPAPPRDSPAGREGAVADATQVLAFLPVAFVLWLFLHLIRPFQGANAFPLLTSAVPNGHGVPCPDGAAGCSNGLCSGLGHASCLGGALPLNPFGEDLRAHNNTWTRALCETDSDGDGFTNGFELGDPCCTWAPGHDAALASAAYVHLSHPGDADAAPSLEVQALYADLACLDVAWNATAAAEEAAEEAAIFLEGETPHMLELRPEPWEVPTATTTYKCFFFEYPEDRPYHIVGFEPLVSTV